MNISNNQKHTKMYHNPTYRKWRSPLSRAWLLCVPLLFDNDAFRYMLAVSFPGVVGDLMPEWPILWLLGPKKAMQMNEASQLHCNRKGWGCWPIREYMPFPNGTAGLLLWHMLPCGNINPVSPELPVLKDNLEI